MLQRVDPELMAGLQAFAAMSGDGGLDLEDIAATRTAGAAMLEAMKAQMPAVPGVGVEDLRVPGADGAPAVAVRIYRPEVAGELPVLLWIHGGGYVIGSIDQDDLLAKQMALAAQCAVVSVEYRLAPEHPFPAPLEDCYAALQWIHRNARELRFDAARIGVGGASAGGGLAAGLALLARDRGDIALAFQLLIYPMIDDCNIAPADAASPDTLMWTRRNNRIGWAAYLGREPGAADIPVHAAPFRATDLCGLPPTYIAVGELDLFVLENLDYGRRLLQAGVPTQLHVYPGAFHGFDAIAPQAAVSQRFAADRDQAVKRALASR